MTDGAASKREVWASLRGFPGYWVSDQGRVRGTDRTDGGGRRWKGRVLKPQLAGSGGHLAVTLRAADGTRRQVYVHRLVAGAFVPNDEGHPVVRHGDDVPGNNHVENLRWGTQAQNMADAKANGRTFRKRTAE